LEGEKFDIVDLSEGVVLPKPVSLPIMGFIHKG